VSHAVRAAANESRQYINARRRTATNERPYGAGFDERPNGTIRNAVVERGD